MQCSWGDKRGTGRDRSFTVLYFQKSDYFTGVERGDTRGFLRSTSTAGFRACPSRSLVSVSIQYCVYPPTPVRNVPVKSHAQTSKDKASSMASSHSCPFYWGAPNLSEHRVAHRLEGPAVLLIPHEAAVHLAQHLAPRSKPRPTEVRPKRRRAGFTSARGCPGWHLGAASLGQMACQPLGPHYCSGLFATQVELKMTRTRD